MKLIVGLGNPGKEYEDTRHNFGFMAVLNFYEHHRDAFGSWKEKFNALISEGAINGEKVMLVLPQIYMNNSGKTVGALARYVKLIPSGIEKLFRRSKSDLSNIWVVHDDIDLPLGATRLSVDAASGGHKGVESIIKHLGGKNFIRFRLGIHSSSRDTIPTNHFVLGKFTDEEKKLVEEVIRKTTSAIDGALQIGVTRVMNEYNR